MGLDWWYALKRLPEFFTEAVAERKEERPKKHQSQALFQHVPAAATASMTTQRDKHIMIGISNVSANAQNAGACVCLGLHCPRRTRAVHGDTLVASVALEPFP
eukprot:CAMPEP_0114320330 /NCGR_PEP_ID=MMETSP0059-20121206/25881_1 /TAXON_ID=36894 /ORGANISM="Pyramimonas parkeae, Strain CCMP726" /LENGTH=102 /DNA_ID=CAMNT_0001447725 /DNA_START=325 /DNA_END=633 /DNA_ORIENTATION=+